MRPAATTTDQWVVTNAAGPAIALAEAGGGSVFSLVPDVFTVFEVNDCVASAQAKDGRRWINDGDALASLHEFRKTFHPFGMDFPEKYLDVA